MHIPHRATPQPGLAQQLQARLDQLSDMCDAIAAHLAHERDRATLDGDGQQVHGVERGLLQVVRIRTHTRAAIRELEIGSAYTTAPPSPIAA